MLRFDSNIVYVLVNKLFIADALSRAPQMAPGQHDKHLKEDAQAYMYVYVFQDFPTTGRRLQQIQRAQENDCIAEAGVRKN